MHIVFDNISTLKSRVVAMIVRMPGEARVTNGLGAMNYRIVARSITIILRRRWRQADGKARIKNVKDGGYDYGLQAWDETFGP